MSKTIGNLDIIITRFQLVEPKDEHGPRITVYHQSHGFDGWTIATRMRDHIVNATLEHLGDVAYEVAVARARALAAAIMVLEETKTA